MKIRFLFVALVLLLSTSVVLAASPYKIYPQQSIVIVTTGASLGIIGRYAERNRANPTTADLSELDEADIPAFDRIYIGDWDTTSHRLSDVLLFGSPLAVLPQLFTGRSRKAMTIGTMYLETMSLTLGGTYFSKGMWLRYRPYAYREDAPLEDRLSLDTTRSFFSGHAANAAANYIFAAKVFSDYYPRSRYKPYVWAGAVSASVATAAFRVTGGKHFLSDVTVGLLWGAAAGYLIPEFHRIKYENLSILPFASEDYMGLMINHSF